ncbi:MAG: DUF4282 domain-containing protein [Burkholderiaceae bacterium]|jgi:hypothetical protein|nr:DUF4282 domain-containing protein [Burkholderiaceae bacterium]
MNFLTFDGEMLTPKIITVLYWLMLLGVVVSGVGVMLSGRGAGMIATFLGGLLVMVLGTIWARICCELLIVLFKMNEALQDLRKSKATL